MKRFARQIQLAEVGTSGQQRIARRRLRPVLAASPEEMSFARLYAERCGLGEAALPSTPLEASSDHYPEEIARHFRHSPSRMLGVGAALVQAQVMRALVEEPDAPGPTTEP